MKVKSRDAISESVNDTGADANTADSGACNGQRRRMLALLGGAAASSVAPLGAHAAVPACVLAPRQSEGPYFLDTRLQRSDIRAGSGDGRVSAGVPLVLRLRVLDVDHGCAPLRGVAVEVWHCDARGVYSGVRDPHAGWVEGDFLRGYQLTDEQGRVRFQTIYPGWYPGRSVHVHIKVKSPVREWTSQLYFDDRVTDRAHAHPAYGGSATRRTRNQQDGLFRYGGERLMLALEGTAEGYSGRFELGVGSLPA